MQYYLTLLLAFLPVVAFGQAVTSVPSKVQAKAVYEESSLETGQHIVFDFTPSDGTKAFGGKVYRIEAESRDTGDKPTFFRGMIEQEKGAPRDQAIIFADDQSPENIVVRVIVDNQTVYRHNITVDKKKPKPNPSPIVSPYSKAIAEAFTVDAAPLSSAQAHAVLYKEAVSALPTLATGKALWDWIEIEYKRLPPIAKTRLAISEILYNDTRSYYDTKLADKDRKALSAVLNNIRIALEGVSVGPPPTPVPVGPKKLWVVVIEETAQSSANRGSYFVYKPLAEKMVSSGHKWKVADKDVKDANGSTPTDLAPYINEAKASGKPLPRLYLVDQVTGDVFYKDTLPATPQALVEILTKIGG